MHALRSGCFEHQAVVMDASVVQQEHYPWPIEGSVVSEALEQLLDEVLEHRGIDAALNQLCSDDGCLSHGR